jgi:glycosyltransferase involved in cell wall biosynthesis
MSSQQPLLFLAWTRTSGRAGDVAAALGGEAVLLHPRVPLLRHPLSTVVRYAVSTLQTVMVLARHRPRAIVVTNPPLIPPLLVATWCALSRTPFVLDSHPSGFGLKGRAVLARLQVVHRWLARRARAVLVTTPSLAEQVNGWGGHGLVVHEAPVAFPEPRTPAVPTVLFVGIFATDEPVQEVVAAARLLPDTRFRITGDVARAPRGLVAEAPGNVTFTGFLGPEQYRSEVASSTLVLTLTTEPESVMRSAYEAVYARVPVVVTDTPALRKTFPYARFTDNDASSLTQALTGALQDLPQLRASCEPARAAQLTRWQDQLRALRAACWA